MLTDYLTQSACTNNIFNLSRRIARIKHPLKLRQFGKILPLHILLNLFISVFNLWHFLKKIGASCSLLQAAGTTLHVNKFSEYTGVVAAAYLHSIFGSGFTLL